MIGGRQSTVAQYLKEISAQGELVASHVIVSYDSIVGHRLPIRVGVAECWVGEVHPWGWVLPAWEEVPGFSIVKVIAVSAVKVQCRANR